MSPENAQTLLHEASLEAAFAALELDLTALTSMALDQWQLHFVELVTRQRESLLEC